MSILEIFDEKSAWLIWFQFQKKIQIKFGIIVNLWLLML
jgi:hypothetical protein